jgi:hypothetical protein
MKKTLSIILSIVMLLSLLAGLDFSVYADDLPSTGKCGTTVTYTFNSETGELVIRGSGTMYNYDSSSFASSYYYTKCPFYNQSSIKSIVINSGVTSIGSYAFNYCSGLTSVTIPDSVKSIGSYAFYGCSSLISITIPDSVKSIGERAFYNCSGLTSVTIPDSVTSIGNYAFSGCIGLTSITKGYGLYKGSSIIASTKLSGCKSTYPKQVTSIGMLHFHIAHINQRNIPYAKKYLLQGFKSVTIGNS